MKSNQIDIELLAPAGNFEKLEIAIHYGADAVYLAGQDFSLRNFSGNFSLDEMQRAISLAHDRGVKVYVACNIYPRSHEATGIRDFLASVSRMDPDGIIISDPGVLMLTRTEMPQVPIHLSTQANTTSTGSANFWKEQGVQRVNVARELSLPEITTLAQETDLEIEAFVHGAMCMAYSGRCLLSNFMAGRDSNRGMCCHPCRFQYAVVEAKRPGEYYHLHEDDHGSYIFNSKDLCMIEHIPALIKAGITSLKIEGRMKGIHYLATVLKVYREAVDAYTKSPETYIYDPAWFKELSKISHRGYCSGFYLEDAGEVTANTNGSAVTGQTFLAKVLAVNSDSRVQIDVRNRICKQDRIEILSARKPLQMDSIQQIYNLDQAEIEVAHPGTRAYIKLNTIVSPNDMIRKGDS